MDVPQSDDTQITALALAAAGGDSAALAAFVRVTQRDVYCFLTYRCEHGQVDNLTRETYLRAVQELPNFAGRSSARAWLLSLARRVAAEAGPTVPRPRTPTAAEGASVASPAHRSSGVDEGILLRELVARLDPDRRDAFVLTQVLGLCYADTAEVCGCPLGAVRSRVARAREDLIRAMHSLGGPPGRRAPDP